MGVTFTEGRMPTIAFSDDADYDTLKSVLGNGWTVTLTLKGGLSYDIEVSSFSADDRIAGAVWNGTDWNGEIISFPLDEVEQIIVH